MSDRDPTFDSQCLFGSILWAATRLGMSKDTFHRKRDSLIENGFPARDKLTNGYLKADVDAWIKSRRQIKENSATITAPDTKGANLDAF